MKKKNFIKVSVLVAIILVGVAYAAITSTLSVGGSTSVKGSSTNFDENVIFNTATASSGSTASISSDKHTITFSTAQLKAVGDQATLTYTIKNNSNYGASISAVTCSSTDTSFATYVTATPSRTTSLTLAKGATSSSETVTIRMIKISVPEKENIFLFP